MKHYFFLFTALCVFLLFCCKGNWLQSEQYVLNKQELQRIRSKAMQHIPITDETGMDSLYEFFKKYGTEDDAYVAGFYKAIYLQQSGDRESAFNMLIELYNQRSSAESDETNDISRKILDFFIICYIWDKDAENLKRWIVEAETTRLFENKSYILYNRKASYFSIIEQKDSCNYYMDLAYNNMMHCPDWDENKSMILAEMAGWYAQRGEHQKFMELYATLNMHPYHGKNDATDFYAGLYYNQIGQRDSAEACFRRALESSAEVSRHAYIQLAIMARNAGQHDSVFSYFQGYVSACDTVILKQQSESTQRLEAAYRNIEHESRIAQQKIFILSLMVLFFGAMILAFIGWRTVMIIRKRIKENTEEHEREKKRWNELLQQMQGALNSYESLEHKKEKQVLLNNKVLEIRRKLNEKGCKIDEIDVSELSQLFIDVHPKFVQRITKEYHRFKSSDLILCIFVINDFGHTEIGRILQRERQQISNIMRRISKNLTGKSVGRMEDFKALLETYLV